MRQESRTQDGEDTVNDVLLRESRLILPRWLAVEGATVAFGTWRIWMIGVTHRLERLTRLTDCMEYIPRMIRSTVAETGVYGLQALLAAWYLHNYTYVFINQATSHV